jgi:osmoprotectant transport system ATP-binding protein
MSAIEFHNVSKRFGKQGFLAVDEISFKMTSGTITCLIGTSGCGKTTTLQMLNKLVIPTSGEIYLDGTPIKEIRAIELCSRMGYVVQKGGLLPHYNIEKNIAFMSIINKTLPLEQALTRAHNLMELLHLDLSLAKKHPSQLSGGQQQRVGIARALMGDPPILLMDEPFGALDPVTRSSIQDELLALNVRLKKTIILVTHDLSEAFKLSDQIVLMNKGKVVQVGTKTDFLERPASEFAKSFVLSQVKELRANLV